MTSVLAHNLVADPTAFEMPAGLPSEPVPPRRPSPTAPRRSWQSAPVVVIDWRYCYARTTASRCAARVLTVILIPEEHPTGAWLGVTAWVTKGRDLRDYDAHETGDDADDEQGGTSR